MTDPPEPPNTRRDALLLRGIALLCGLIAAHKVLSWVAAGEVTTSWYEWSDAHEHYGPLRTSVFPSSFAVVFSLITGGSLSILLLTLGIRPNVCFRYPRLSLTLGALGFVGLVVAVTVH